MTAAENTTYAADGSRKEGLMASITFTSIVAAPASGPGALDHFKCECSCGLVLRSSFASILRSDVAEHAAWHARKAAK